MTLHFMGTHVNKKLVTAILLAAGFAIAQPVNAATVEGKLNLADGLAVGPDYVDFLTDGSTPGGPSGNFVTSGTSTGTFETWAGTMGTILDITPAEPVGTAFSLCLTSLRSISLRTSHSS
jgi:hypothetical protein